MENTPPTNLPETLPISGSSEDNKSEDISAAESVVGVSTSLPTSFNEDCSSSAEIQKVSSPLCPPLTSDSQIDSTVQEVHYGSQTDKDEGRSNIQTKQIPPPKEGVGLEDIMGTKKKNFVTLEYKPETTTNIKLHEKEHKGKSTLLESQSQICFTVPSSPVPQSSFGTTEHGTEELSDGNENQSSHTTLPAAAEQTCSHQDSKSSVLPSHFSDDSKNIQTDTSKTKLENKGISNDTREIQKANSLQSIQMFEHVKDLAHICHKDTHSTETLDTPKTGELLPGLYTSENRGSVSGSTPGRDNRNTQSSKLHEGEQVESSTRKGHPDTGIFCTSTQASSSKPSAASPQFDTSLVVPLPVEEFATTDKSDQVLTTETPLTAELVHSTDTQEIVVVRGDTQISGCWSNLHLNQSYLLREDGSVCEAAILNEISSELSTREPKLYEEGIQAVLHSQPVEVYEFCGLVEEVAEETVCASTSAQIHHSPGYEVNLFNALLENPDDYPDKEDLALHFEPSIHAVNEGDAVIITQPLPTSHDVNQVQPCSNSNSHNLSMKNAVEEHLTSGANQAVERENSSEACLVEGAAETPGSFTVEQTQASQQILKPCAQISVASQNQKEVNETPASQSVLLKQEAEARAGVISLISPVVSGEDMGLEPSVNVVLHLSDLENQTPIENISASKPGLTQTQRIMSVTASTESKPGVFPITLSSSITNPNLVLLKQGETPLLKQPPSLLKQVSKQQNLAGKLANAHSSWPGTMSKECLPQTISAAGSSCASVPLSSHQDQIQCSVETSSVDADLYVNVQPRTLSSNISPQLEQTTSSTSRCDSCFSVTETSITESDLLSQDVIVPTDATQSSVPNKIYMLTASVDGEGTVTASRSPNDPVSQPESFYMEDDSEDMEQDEPMGELEAQEAMSGQVSSPEEASDEEPDPDKTESEMNTPSLPHKHGQSRTDKKTLFQKVRQWISNRVTANSSPVSPSTSSPYPGPSPTSDWSMSRRERSSPLRGPHGKFVSPSSFCAYSSSSSPTDQATPQRPRGERHTDMAELAKHEADIEHRTQALKREGFWSTKRLTRLMEPPRPKVHWDYLCEEMQWLSADFAQERRWKRGVARKVVRMVMRHHEELRQKEEKAKRDEHAKIRRVASSIAKEVRAFWSNVEKVVQYKQQSRLEEKRKKALDLQLDFIVGQTEKYSDLLSKSLAPIRPPEIVPLSPKKSLPPAVDEEDRDFEPPCEEEDDEETIEVEEQQEGNDAESHRREIELLKEEGLLPLDQLLSTLNLPQDSGTDEECSEESSSSAEEEEEDGEFTANEEDAEDEEDTIAAQEKVEGNVDHAEELDDLAREGNMSVEELLEKYKGAYASDYEVHSASGSESEVSGDEEEESEEDESDAESNTSSSDSPGDSAEDDDSEKDVEESEELDEDDDCGHEGTELLLKEGDNSPPSSSSRPKKEISHIAATAESLQPKGYTLATTKVKTPIPFLLHGTLREYQHIGLDWLVTMYEKKLNGILADEMGLGKTIQTIALLAHLACEKGNWGPHLIIVPTSVMLNWEMELKRWCPGFKILTYFGSQKERKLKRQGWTKPNAFHVCITSYKLVLQDHQAFRRKSWRYLILDEAQNIKNFKSQRWQSLLNFNSHRRLLLTGTPLQNSLMELWSLMHFLMPHVFQSHREFKEWFSNPLTGMIEGSQEYNEGLVKRLHKVLRPFLLRRIKVDVEKQMPKKYEHVVRCRLSKRQRFLYDDFMAQASTRETLASGHFMSVINILMQLRKVCNHPNLFDPRPIQSPFIMQPIVFHTASLVQDALEIPPLKRCDLSIFDLIGMESRVSRYQADVFLPRYKVSRQLIQEIMESPEPPPRPKPVRMKVNRMFQPPPKGDNRPVLLMNKPTCSVAPAAQTPKPPAVTEISSAQTPAPVVQQVVCSVTTTPSPRPPVHLTAQTAVRSSVPKPVLTVRPPTASCTASIPVHPSPSPMPQRVLLSPDMQARLPSGEVVSIAQLASLAGRPVSSCQGSKPVTFQLQGNKLTLSGAQIHQVPAAPPRPVQGNVMHLVSSGAQQHHISQSAPFTAQSTVITNTAPSIVSANRLPHSATSQVNPPMVSSPGIVKIVVRQTAGKEGGPVPTLAVAPSPRVAPQASPSTLLHANTNPVRNTAPLQIAQRTAGPATAHYTIAPPGNPSSTPNLSHPPRPILKVVQPPPSSTDQSAPVQASSTSMSKSLSTPQDNSSSQTTAATMSKPNTGTKACPPSRKVPRPPPRSPFFMSWLGDSLKEQHDSRMDFIVRVNECHCGAKPLYGQEVLDFLTFLPGPSPKPAALTSQGDWTRSGQSSCFYAQWQNKNNYWFQSQAVREAIHSIENRLEQLNDVIERFTFAIPTVEGPPISMHSCHPPPSLSNKQAAFISTLSTQVTPLFGSLHRIQCNMRTQFPDLRLIEYDCGKLQTLHTLLQKLKIGSHRVLIFTQMTRMLDVLEQFLNYHGHIYLRLDGNTRVEQRQALMERFNADQRIFCFILSTRSGGVGVNLTGADTVIFYDSDWNPTMDAQAQDRCHRIGQTRDVHIYRLISERTVEENILKKANQKRMLGDMAIEGGNFTTAFFKQQTIRELFDMNDGEKREVVVELSLPQAEEEEAVNKQSTTILEQALCRAEDEEDIVAASQAKAEQVAELAEFNENIPLDDGGEQEDVEELSKAEQEIAALVEQLTPIERYAMNFLEASLEDVCKEELKQAEEQVEAARKGLDQAKEEGLKLHASSDDEDDDFLSPPASLEPVQPTPARRGRKPKDKDRIVTSTRMSGRLRGASPETEPEPTIPKEVPEKPRLGLRGRGAAKDTSTVSTTPPQHKTSSSNRLHDSSRSSKAASPVRDPQPTKTRTLPNPSHTSPVLSAPAPSPPGGEQQNRESDSKNTKSDREEEQGESEKRVSESLIETSCPADRHSKDDDSKDNSSMSPPSTCSRSPRKRQSADNEVLRGLVEDSPSAKVLRKLPGRLVTVVEEKEPRKRRRRGSSTGGDASEEATVEETTTGLVEEPHKDNTSPSTDTKTKGTVDPSKDHDSTPSPSVHPQPVRCYPPYSPPHLSPDMPVLRNLPVRRRLETESRMAAQMGEQQQYLGRGRGGNQSRKTDTPPGKAATSTSADSSVNPPVAPLKRKRGRPPKTPSVLPESDNIVTPSTHPISPSEEGTPPVSPKRKRGRPRLTNMPESVGKKSKNDTTACVPDTSKADARTEPTVPRHDKLETPTDTALTTNQASQSIRAEETHTKTEGSTTDSAQPSIATDQTTPVSDLIQGPVTLRSGVADPTAASTQSLSLAPGTVGSHVSTSAAIPITATPTTTTSCPHAIPVTSAPPGVKPTPVVSPASPPPVEPESSVSTIVKTTEPDSTKASTPAATAHSTVSSSRTVSTRVAATSVTTATDSVSATAGMAPAATTAKSLPDKTAAGKDLVQASSLLPSTSNAATATLTVADTQKVLATCPPKGLSKAMLTSAPTTLTPTLADTQTASAAAASPSIFSPERPSTSVPATVTSASAVVEQATATILPSASTKPSLTSAPTTVTYVTRVKASSSETTKPKTVPTSGPVISDTSTTPLVSTTSSPAADTVPSSPVETAEMATQAQVVAVSVTRIPSVAPVLVCITPPTTTSANVTTVSKEKTVNVTTSPATEGVQVSACVGAASSKQHTTMALSTPPEDTVKIPPTVTSANARPVPLPVIITTALSPEKSATDDITSVVSSMQESTADANQVSVATTAPTVPSLSTAQPSAAIPLQVQTSTSISVSSEVPTLVQTDAQSHIATHFSVSSEKQEVSKSEPDRATEMEVDSREPKARTSKEEDDEKNEDICKPQSKRRRVQSCSEANEHEVLSEIATQKDDPKQKAVEQTNEDLKTPNQKRPLSRQSSQESARSSSPSSGCSTSTLTRNAHHKKTYENRHPNKKKRVDVTLEAGKEEIKEESVEKTKDRSEKGSSTTPLRKRCSRSSSSSSDSDNSESRKEHRLTRLAKNRLQAQEKEKGNSRQGKTRTRSCDTNASLNTNASTGGESGSDTSSARTTRKSTGSQPSQGSKPSTNSPPSLPPEPEVLRKRCSALNAAAKLLAMKGRVDTPGHTPRKEPGAKAAGTSPASSSDKTQKSKSKSVPASPQTNSVNASNSKSSGGKPSTPNQTSRSASRSTRQCPGSLVPPLEMEYKRSKAEDKDRGSRKSSGGKEGEAEAHYSSRGHSACSSMSSDGEGDGGGRSSRSRSSSNSSQRTHSISSQNMEHRESRAASSGSERSSKILDRTEKKGQQRESRTDNKRSQKLPQEVSSGSGTEGTPDRVLRSVAALAAVQARSPAESTRSSAGQHRQNKT